MSTVIFPLLVIMGIVGVIFMIQILNIKYSKVTKIKATSTFLKALLIFGILNLIIGISSFFITDKFYSFSFLAISSTAILWFLNLQKIGRKNQ